MGIKGTNKKNESTYYGYCPHRGMTNVVCPCCGGDTFVGYPQSVPADAEVWTYEYHCAQCKHMVGLTVKKWR